MDIIDAMLGEHAVLYELFDYLEGEIPRLSNLEMVKACGRMLTVAVQRHLVVEDALLCSLLEDHAGRQPPMVGCEISHEEIDREIARFEASHELGEAGGRLLGVIGLTHRHSQGQERWLFPLARRTIAVPVLERQAVVWLQRRGIEAGHSSAATST